MKQLRYITALLLLIAMLSGLLSGCAGSNVVDLVGSASEILINGKKADTVEAKMGAFSGKQGSVIEIRFEKASKLNTVYIVEKTAVIDQYNIYAEVNGKFKLVYTGKQLLAQNLTFETVTATALKVQILNTTPGKGNFIITGINAYDLEATTQKQ